MQQNYREIPTDLIDRDPGQPRQKFDGVEMDELIASVRNHGILTPIIVRAGEGEGRYIIIAGERRWRAAGAIQLSVMPCIVRQERGAAAAEMALIENVQRSALSPIEEAHAYHRLVVEEGRSQQVVADAIGKSRTEIAQRLRLLALSKSIQDWIDDGALGAGHGKALLAAPETARVALAESAVKAGWSVRATEKAARAALKSGDGSGSEATKKSAASSDESVFLRDLERRVGDTVGLPTNIDHGPAGGGTITLQYSNLDEMDGLLMRLGVSTD